MQPCPTGQCPSGLCLCSCELFTAPACSRTDLISWFLLPDWSVQSPFVSAQYTRGQDVWLWIWNQWSTEFKAGLRFYLLSSQKPKRFRQTIIKVLDFLRGNAQQSGLNSTLKSLIYIKTIRVYYFLELYFLKLNWIVCLADNLPQEKMICFTLNLLWNMQLTSSSTPSYSRTHHAQRVTYAPT